MLDVVQERGILQARPRPGFGRDEDCGASRYHVQGMRQKSLPQVPIADIKPQIPDGMHVLRRAFNSEVRRGRGPTAPGLAPGHQEHAPGGPVSLLGPGILLRRAQVAPYEAEDRGKGRGPRGSLTVEPGDYPVPHSEGLRPQKLETRRARQLEGPDIAFPADTPTLQLGVPEHLRPRDRGD